MTRLHEQLHTDLPVEQTFDYIADFANSQVWDPGVAWARRTSPADAPIGVGTTYELGIPMGGRVAPMTYRITRFERPGRVTLTGSGSGVEAVDDIVFTSNGDGTKVDYTADIRLGGALRMVQPFLGSRFDRIGRDAAAGMAETLARLARTQGAAGDAG
jgi:carbon monoxide dehydrogenase subunit G